MDALDFALLAWTICCPETLADAYESEIFGKEGIRELRAAVRTQENGQRCHSGRGNARMQRALLRLAMCGQVPAKDAAAESRTCMS